MAGGGKSGIPIFEVLTYFAKPLPIANSDYHLMVCFMVPKFPKVELLKIYLNFSIFHVFSSFREVRIYIVYLQYQCPSN